MAIALLLRRKIFSFVFLLPLLLFPSLAVRGDELKLVPSLGLALEANDNYFFDDENQVGEIIAIISPGVELVERTERVDARFQGWVNWRNFAYDDELDTLDQFYNGYIQYRLQPRMSISVAAAYTRDSQPDRDIKETGFILNTTVRRRQYCSILADYEISDITSSQFVYAFTNDQFEGPALNDNRAHILNLGFNRDLRDLIPRTTGRTNLGYSKYIFEDSMVENYTWTLGGFYKFNELFSILVDLGPRYTVSTTRFAQTEALPPFQVVATEKEEDWGGVGQALLAYDGELTNGKLMISSDLLPASGRNEPTQRTQFTLDIGHRFTYELSAHFLVGYFLNQSRQGVFPLGDINEETLFITPTIRYDFTKDVFIEGTYTYVNIKNRVIDREVDQNVFLIILRFQHRLLE